MGCISAWMTSQYLGACICFILLSGVDWYSSTSCDKDQVPIVCVGDCISACVRFKCGLWCFYQEEQEQSHPCFQGLLHVLWRLLHNQRPWSSLSKQQLFLPSVPIFLPCFWQYKPSVLKWCLPHQGTQNSLIIYQRILYVANILDTRQLFFGYIPHCIHIFWSFLRM